MNSLFLTRRMARSLAWGFVTFFAFCIPGACLAQILETETARVVGKGVLEIGSNFEYQVSAEGYEAALPFAIEYGFTRRLEFLIEPVAYTGIHPKSGQHANGIGDAEATLTYLVHGETHSTPALALAGEVKFPIARNTAIGTGMTDFAGYLIASKQFGHLDTHADVGYTVVGKPAAAQLSNIFNFAFGWELGLASRTELYGEFLANTAATSVPESATPGPLATSAPEAPSGEIVGSLGLARWVLPSFRLSFGVSVDNNGALLFRPGFTVRRP